MRIIITAPRSGVSNQQNLLAAEFCFPTRTLKEQILVMEEVASECGAIWSLSLLQQRVDLQPLLMPSTTKLGTYFSPTVTLELKVPPSLPHQLCATRPHAKSLLLSPEGPLVVLGGGALQDLEKSSH
jgi:hypothetical protein